MKERISASIEEESSKMLDEIFNDEELNFRNKSHAIEYCIKKVWNEGYGKTKKK